MSRPIYCAFEIADVKDSVWIGGSSDLALYERTPYWLNGIVPMAFQLQAAGSAVAAPCMEQVHLNGPVLFCEQDCRPKPMSTTSSTTSTLTDGLFFETKMRIAFSWCFRFGPLNDSASGDQIWPRTNILLTLTMWAEGKPEVRFVSPSPKLNHVSDIKMPAGV